MFFGLLREFMVEIFAGITFALSIVIFNMLRRWRSTILESSKTKNGIYWSPDNTRVCFITGKTSAWDIFVIDTKSGEKKKLASSIVKCEAPIWSPDGDRIAFVSDREGNCEIYVANVISNDVQRITYDPLDNVRPNWSPDGKFLTYLTMNDDQVEVSVLRIE